MYIKRSLFLALVIPIVVFFAGLIVSGIREGIPAASLGLDRGQWINIGLSGAGIFVLLAPWYLGSLEWEWIGKATRTEPVNTVGLVNWLPYYAKDLQANGLLLFYTLSFQEPRLTDPTGKTVPDVDPTCQLAPEREFEKLMDMMKKQAGTKTPLILATHPFNQSGLLWNDEMIYYFMEVWKYRKKQLKVEKPGYSPLLYDLFYRDMDRIDFLLADQALFSADPGWLTEQVKAWRDNETLHEKNLNIPDDDPGLIRKIEQEFSPIGTLSSKCFPPVYVLKRH